MHKTQLFQFITKKYPLKENIDIMNFLLSESEEQNWITSVPRIQHE